MSLIQTGKVTLALSLPMRENGCQANPLRSDAMAYELDQFISDCRSILARDPGPNGREQVRTRLEQLLQNPDFVRKHCEDAPRGLHVLYEDPKLGFQVLAHIHDQPTHNTDMIEWEREDNGGDEAHAKLKPVKKYRLTPGKAGIYQDGKIHSIDYPDYSRFVRVTGTNLDKINRVRSDLKTGAVHPMTPQQAT